MFIVSYKKNNNKKLFEKLKKDCGFDKIQNYIPIYKKFFSLNENTYNSVNLNHKYNISDVKKIIDDNNFSIELKDSDNNPL